MKKPDIYAQKADTDTNAAVKARELAQLPEIPQNDANALWREWMFSETPAAGEPADDLRQFCEEHKM